MLEVLEDNLLEITKDLKIISIFPDNKVIYLYGNDDINHNDCFQTLANTYFKDNEEVMEYIKDDRIYTFQNYLVKYNFVLLLNLRKVGQDEMPLLAFFQDDITYKQEEILFKILEKSKFNDITICIHNADDRYGPYHFEEHYETSKTLKKERYLVV